jgi:hypothetical protein
MTREPVNVDDPELTAYALDEMNLAERAAFEVRLQASPTAQRELKQMEAMMDLLSLGLARELRAEVGVPGLRLIPAEEKIVAFVPAQQTSWKRGALAAAAAVVLSGAIIGQWVGGSGLGEVDVAANLTMGLESLPENGAASPVSLNQISHSVDVHVPRLFLAEEMGDLASLDLAKGESAPVDTTYLEADGIVPASYSGDGLRSQALALADELSQTPVDSYLANEWGVEADQTGTGLIEARRNGLVASAQPSGSGTVLVRGYIPMGGTTELVALDAVGGESLNFRVNDGFRPVSITGELVKDPNANLGDLAELKKLQSELSQVVSQLPDGQEERLKLEQLLERNQAAMESLKESLAH